MRAGEVLDGRYVADPSELDERWGGVAEAPPAVMEVVRRVPAALTTAGIALAEDFAVSATHFEGYGGLKVLEAVADRSLWEKLKRRGELPQE